MFLPNMWKHVKAEREYRRVRSEGLKGRLVISFTSGM